MTCRLHLHINNLINEKNDTQRLNQLIKMDNLNSLDFLQWISFTNFNYLNIFKQVLTHT